MENLKKQLQNIWENLAFQSKMFFKSYDSSINWQILLMILPMWLTLVSFYLNGWDWAKILDYISFWLSILAMCGICFFEKILNYTRSIEKNFYNFIKKLKIIIKQKKSIMLMILIISLNNKKY